MRGRGRQRSSLGANEALCLGTMLQPRVPDAVARWLWCHQGAHPGPCDSAPRLHK